jgi:hypothetical protein
MALSALTVWEFASGGSMNNGGGYVACSYASAVAIQAGGTGYSVNNTLTVSGGTNLGQAITLNVDSVNGGAVTGVTIKQCGGYTGTLPTNPVATTVSPAGGSGCTLNLTWTANTDYSRNSVVLNKTDVYHAAGSTTITSDGGGFTAAMTGNLLKCVSGTAGTFTVGWYTVASWLNTNNVVLDRTLNATANTQKDITINVGGALAYGIAAEDTAFHAATIAGNTVWYNGGNTSPGTTFTPAGNIAGGTGGSAPLPIVCQGYRQTRGDVCVGAYRPTIACAAYTFASATYRNWYNLMFTGTAANVFSGSRYAVVNCKVTNSSASAGNAFGATSPGECHYIGCETIAPMGTGINSFGSSVMLGCYVHDCAIGIAMTVYDVVANCVIETCSSPATGYGIQMYGAGGGKQGAFNNTIRNCKSGVYSSATVYGTLINNIITDCLVGADWVTAAPLNIWDYNCFYGNTTPRTNVTAGPNDIATDPVLTGVIGKGTDGSSVAGSLVFASASNPFAGVTTSDYLAIFAGTGTGIKKAVYAITSVASIPGQITLATDPTDASHNISSCTFGVVKGSDFTLDIESTCMDVALDAGTYSGVAV